MKKNLTIAVFSIILSLSTVTSLGTGWIAFEIAKGVWAAQSIDVPPNSLSQHFGNMALIGLIFSLVVGSSSATILFKTLKT